MLEIAATTDDGDERRTTTNPRRRVLNLYSAIQAGTPEVDRCLVGTENFETIGGGGQLRSTAIGVTVA